MRLVAGIVVLTIVASACGPAASGASRNGPVEPSAGSAGSTCPATARALPADAVARAADQALVEAAAVYRGTDTRGTFVVDAVRASEELGPRESEVRQQCGGRIARRTVVVDLTFPRMQPSASLSQGTVFISLFPHGYRVWEVAH
jgi:adenylyl- and sulfurtransferase ThiI